MVCKLIKNNLQIMSKNRNRSKLRKAKSNREYNILLKSEGIYCIICAKRNGNFHGLNCHPSYWNQKGYRWRENRSWKNHRKNQYNE